MDSISVTAEKSQPPISSLNSVAWENIFSIVPFSSMSSKHPMANHKGEVMSTPKRNFLKLVDSDGRIELGSEA